MDRVAWRALYSPWCHRVGHNLAIQHQQIYMYNFPFLQVLCML